MLVALIFLPPAARGEHGESDGVRTTCECATQPKQGNAHRCSSRVSSARRKAGPGPVGHKQARGVSTPTQERAADVSRATHHDPVVRVQQRRVHREVGRRAGVWLRGGRVSGSPTARCVAKRAKGAVLGTAAAATVECAAAVRPRRTCTFTPHCAASRPKALSARSRHRFSTCVGGREWRGNASGELSDAGKRTRTQPRCCG